MIPKIREWCETIIVAIVISIIIEMLIPNGNNKKYIKVVIGVYILFVTLNPILELLSYDLDFDKLFEMSVIETSTTDFDENIKDVYINGIKDTMKNEIKELGYKVEKLEITFDPSYTNIEKIEIKIVGKENNINKVEPVTIRKENTEENVRYDDIIKFLIENYLVKEEDILFT